MVGHKKCTEFLGLMMIARTILHDPEVYKDPLAFNPDRFLKNGELDPSVRDPIVASFGFGRRICPGRFFSHTGFFAIVAHVLSVFDIRESLDENGNEVKIIPNMTDGLIS
jgi:cytochrome P450